MAAGADPSADWPEGVARHVLESTDSTMAEAARLAPHLSGPAWILAHRQTAGHGRRGRAWADAPGNFAATLVFHPATDMQGAALYSFVAALALDAALSRVTGPAASLSLKWPNDVLLNGGKIAGILLESAGRGPAPAHLAIGFGVNLAHAPPPPDAVEGAGPAAAPAPVPPVSLAGETGVEIAPEDFLPFLAVAFALEQARYRAFGFGPIREAWLSRAARLGTRITARTMTETYEGVFETVDAAGALVLATASGRIAIPAADVYF